MASTYVDLFLEPRDKITVLDRDDGGIIKVADRATIYLNAAQELALLAQLLGRAKASGFLGAEAPVVGVLRDPKPVLRVIGDGPQDAA